MPFNLLPVKTAVRGAIQAGPWAAARKAPWLSPHLPQRSEQRVWISRVENDVDPTCIAVAEQYALPGFAAICRPEDSSLVVGSEGMSECGDECDIRISRMYDNGPEVTRAV